MWHHGQLRILLSRFLFSWMMHRSASEVSQKWVVSQGTSEFGWQSQVTDFFSKDEGTASIGLKKLLKVSGCDLSLRLRVYTKSRTPMSQRVRFYHCAHPGGLAPCQDLGQEIPEARCDLSKAARSSVVWGTRTHWSSEVMQAFSLGEYKCLKYIRTQFLARALLNTSTQKKIWPFHS